MIRIRADLEVDCGITMKVREIIPFWKPMASVNCEVSDTWTG